VWLPGHRLPAGSGVAGDLGRRDGTPGEARWTGPHAPISRTRGPWCSRCCTSPPGGASRV